MKYVRNIVLSSIKRALRC